ncbi:MAG: hypothetical protein AAB443_04055 [Patescibacteria group bacterium]
MTKKSSFILGFYFALLIWWIGILISDITDLKVNYMFGVSFGILPLVGGYLGIMTSKSWGLLRSYFGRAIFFVSLGLITWGVGELIWSYYNLFLGVEVPYPSLADVGFVLSWPLWSVGMIYLSKATGAKYSVKRSYGKLLSFVIPAVSLWLTYYLVVVLANNGSLDISGGPLATFFVFAYPVGDVVILSLSLLSYGLSFGYLGGKYNIPIILLLLSFVVNYVGDVAFSYTTTAQTYFNGNWVDMVFTTAFFLMSFSINMMVPPKDRNS